MDRSDGHVTPPPPRLMAFKKSIQTCNRGRLGTYILPKLCCDVESARRTYGRHLWQQSMGQLGKVANPAGGQLNTENIFSVISRSPLRIWSRETGSAILSRVSLLIFHTQAESGAYSRDSSGLPRRRPFINTVNRYRFILELIRSRIYVPMASTAESPPAQGR